MIAIRVFCVLAALLAATGIAQAQELRYDPGKQIEYDGPTRYLIEGPVVFNGTEHAVFFAVQGPDDKDYNLYFRRLDRDAVPTGPQVRLTTDNGYEQAVAAAWDGQAYIVFYTFNEDTGANLLRVSAGGAVLARATIPGSHRLWLYGEKGSPGWSRPFVDVVDGNVNLFFTSGESANAGKTYLARVKSTLAGAVTLQTFSAGGMDNAALLGVGADARGYLVLLGQLGASDGEVKDVRFQRTSYDGVMDGSPFASPVTLVPAESIAGPVFNGSAFLLLATQRVNGVLKNRSLLLGSDHAQVGATVELGEASTPFIWQSVVWNGVQVSAQMLAYSITGEGVILFNSSGHFLSEPLYYLDSFYSVSLRPAQTFSGLNTTVVYAVYSPVYKGDHFLANQITLPDSLSAPKIYQLELSPEKLASGKRLLHWGSAGGSTVSIAGKGVSLKNLPPIGHTAIAVKNKKLRLRLTVTGPGGMVKKKIVLKP